MRGLRTDLASNDSSAFWGRDDLTYLGDLSWCQLPTNGHEYIADWTRHDGQFQYTYGLINLAEDGALSGGMIIPVRGPLDGSGRFEMFVGDNWLEGPLRMWLEQLTPAVQQHAIDRYKGLIAWVSRQLDEDG
ncbi:hypothetical protein [Aphanothece microscopica]|uniref:hypothetical protein n=1 Tax=Aphanothece microscopica TaxID=1049561 RepID=UPI003CE5BC79